MNCPKCNTQNETGALYCAQCGAPLQGSPAQGTVVNTPTPPPPPQTRRRSKTPVVVVSILLVAAILLVLAGFLLLPKKPEQPVPPAKTATAVSTQQSDDGYNPSESNNQPDVKDGKQPAESQPTRKPDAAPTVSGYQQPSYPEEQSTISCTKDAILNANLVPENCVLIINSESGKISTSIKDYSWESPGAVIAIGSGATINSWEVPGGKVLATVSSTARDTFCNQVQERQSLVGKVVKILQEPLSGWKPCSLL